MTSELLVLSNQPVRTRTMATCKSSSMMWHFIIWFVLLTSCGRLSSKIIMKVEQGTKVLLFGNVNNTDKGVSLYINGKRNNTFIVTWTIENTTITATWMPDFMANYSKIFMDPMRKIWVSDFDENYEGTYSILGSPSDVVELIKFACAPNKYGPRCDFNCQCEKGNTVQCDSKTGHCLCKPGWQGISCSEPCPFSYYGENCSKACSCLNNGKCSHITGQCECQAGYKGYRCGDRCDEGTFGYNCQGKCNCQPGITCDPHSGNCVSTSGNSHQLNRIADYMLVIIVILSAFFLLIIIMVIIKYWKKCCKIQENTQGPDSIKVQDRDGPQLPIQPIAEPMMVKESGGINPVPPREPNTSIDNSGETSPFLSENQASDSASNKLSVEINPCLPKEKSHHLPKPLLTPMNIPESETGFKTTSQGKKKIHIRETKF